jgi:hypothetical protein
VIRRTLILLSSLAAIAALGVALIGQASSAPSKPDLTVSDLQEPPETATAGSTFRETFSVANQSGRKAGKRTSTSFFLDQTPDSSTGRTSVGKGSVSPIAGQNETSKRARLTVPAGLAAGEYFLVGCADSGKKLKEAKETNNCKVSGQTIGIGQTRIGPPGPPGVTNETTIDKFTLPIGRATVDQDGGAVDAEGDSEKSDQRKEFAKVGPVSLVADCKRTDNGNGGAPDAPFTSPNSFNEDGDEAKVLVYTDSGTVTFNSLGGSSRRNIPPGEGEVGDPDPGAYTQAEESDGGEGAHMGIAAARDPDQTTPEDDWGFAYRVRTLYISHSNGTELIFTGFAGIDVLGADDQCVFGGVLKTVRVGA